jgi:hypothetical protein
MLFSLNNPLLLCALHFKLLFPLFLFLFLHYPFLFSSITVPIRRIYLPPRLTSPTVNIFPLPRSCWLELAELCVTQKYPPPAWSHIDPQNSANQYNKTHKKDEKSGTSKGNGQDARVMYLCFLSHYYLELQHGDKAMKVLEGVLHIFPNSQIATSQVRSLSFPPALHHTATPYLLKPRTIPYHTTTFILCTATTYHTALRRASPHCTVMNCTAPHRTVGRSESLLYEGLREGAECVREGQGEGPSPHGTLGRVLQHPVCEGEEG